MPDNPRVNLRLLEGRYAVCRLDPGEAVAAWPQDGEFCSITRTAAEVSVVCAESAVPEGAKCEGGWRILEVEGPLEFALTGILAAVANPLARAGVSIFAVSTYDTDYVMVKEEKLEEAVRALAAAGHGVKRPQAEGR
jgi:hypothetical protein